MKNKKSLGQIAFEAFYGILCEWKENHDQLVWEEAAKAVEREVRRRMKAPKKIGKKGRK